MSDGQIRFLALAAGYYRIRRLIMSDSRTERPKRIPLATYRLQFNSSFTVRDAVDLLPYLSELGISDVYASPIFQARRGSAHGYDVCDHNRLNPELGSERDFEAFFAGLREHDLGLLLDIVPNHMGTSDPANHWWMDVLEFGLTSSFARFFDIDWNSSDPALRGKVLLPVLGDFFGRVLERGEIKLAWPEGVLGLNYHTHQLPLAPRSLVKVLMAALARIPSPDLGTNDFLQCLNQARTCPEVEQPARFAALKEQVRVLKNDQSKLSAAVQQTLTELNGRPGEPRSFDRLEGLIDEQHYRLAYWRVSSDELNYRRFFEITDLVALRMEDPQVFEATHRLLSELLRAGKVTGLRVDHPDGLRHPGEYFGRLQTCYATAISARGVQGDATTSSPRVYVVAEKILSSGERLPSEWAVDGTTGYDFLNEVNALFVDSANAGAFTRIYEESTGNRRSAAEVVRCGKKLILENSLAGETQALARRLKLVATKHRIGRDLTLAQLRAALVEVIAALPVYRTYLMMDSETPSAQDRSVIETAIADARRSSATVWPETFDFVQRLLLLENLGDFVAADQMEVREFVQRFQQLTGPAAAKGVEDTAFYIYHPLLSLNEAGGDLRRFGGSVEEFHQQNLIRHEGWPHSMLATATHDTKRGEDGRARLNVLSEIPDEWSQALERWRELNAARKRIVAGQLAPDANEEYLLYQTLLSAWPERSEAKDLGRFRERIRAYVIKASREAKRHTSWLDPHPEYEAALIGFVDDLLTPPQADPFLNDFSRLQRKTAEIGQFNSLGQTLLKITSPGVPDFYQGAELWDLSLVDPDNRQPVNFPRRREILSCLPGKGRQGDRDFISHFLRHSKSGEAKLYVIHAALQFRRAHAELFTHGRYIPVSAFGSKARHVCAFLRVWRAEAVLVVVPRLVATLLTGAATAPVGPQVWEDTSLELPENAKRWRFHNVFTGDFLSASAIGNDAVRAVAQVLESFPLALLYCVH